MAHECDSKRPSHDRAHTGRRQFLVGAGMAAVTPLACVATGTAAKRALGEVRDRRPVPASGRAGIKALLERKEPVTWVLTGDSITHGALHTRGWRSYPEHFAERVRWELRRVRDLVINTGISGDRTGGLLADLDWRALHLKPDVVSVMLGMNDCAAGEAGRDEFRRNLTEIVRRVSTSGAIPVLNTPNTIYVQNAVGRADLPAYAQIVRDVGRDTQTLVIDHYAYWQEVKPDPEALLAWIEDKSIHPGVYGHRAFARLIFRELGIFDPQSPTCQLEVP